MRKWLTGVAVIGLIFNLSAVFGQDAPAAEKPVYEVALIITNDKLIPGEIYIPEGEDLRLHVLNIGKLDGQFSAPGLKEAKVLKPGKVETFLIPAALTTQDAKCTFICEKTKFKATAPILIGAPEEGKTLEVVMIGQRMKFLPEVVSVPAKQPLMVTLYSLVNLPHSDFGLLGTNIKLPYANKKLTTVEIKEGLSAGTYLLSRPGFPKQKHNIKTRFEVMEIAEESE
jgi:hypothetical protein